MTTVFQRAHIISPDVAVPDASLVVKDGVITALYLPGEAIPKSALEPVYDPVEYIDLGGDLLLPGFFDIHTHGCAKHDFCDATQEAMAAMARHKLTQGVTSFLGTTLTLSEERLDEVFAHPQVQHRKMLQVLRHPDIGEVPTVRNPMLSAPVGDLASALAPPLLARAAALE